MLAIHGETKLMNKMGIYEKIYIYEQKLVLRYQFPLIFPSWVYTYNFSCEYFG